MLLLQCLTTLYFRKRTCKARADVIDNTSQQQFMLKCFVNFILAEHVLKLAFKLISFEIAFVK